MADQIGRFLINSDIVNTVSRTVGLPIKTNASTQFLSVTTGEGSHALFVVVKDASASLFYQFSFSVGFNFTGNNWLEVVPLESTLGTNNGLAIDFKSDGLTGYLRLRRKYGETPITAHILVYNLGYDADTVSINIEEEDASVIGSIISTPQGSTIGGGSGGISDHNALLNRGVYHHEAIDAHINHANPHTNHEYASNKGIANGYAPLDADTKVPYYNIRTGHTAGTVLPGDSDEIERISRKNSANGYAGLGADTKVPIALLPVGTAITSVMRGDGPGIEKLVNKDVPNGYSGLDAERFIPRENIKFGNSYDSVCRGNDPRLSSNAGVYDNVDVSDQLGEEWYSVAHVKPSYVQNSLKVFLNGSRQIAGLQYEEDAPSARFRFINDVTIGSADKVIVDFRSEV